MSKRKILFIVNPASAGSRTLARWQDVVPKLDKADLDYSVRFTDSRGCASRFAKIATVGQAYDTIVSVGGDGTANEILNGMMDAGVDFARLPAFSIFPSGTGSDTVRTLGIPQELDSFVQMVEQNVFKSYDVGIVEFTTVDEQTGVRYFLNACDVGLGAAVVNAVNSMNQNDVKKSGKAKYFRSIMEQVVKFKAFNAEFVTNGRTVTLKNTVIVAVCNGMFFGGGVKISPISQMDDGKLELVATDNISKIGLMGLVPKVYTGSHAGHPKVRFQQDESFMVKLAKPQLLETDGEVQGAVSEVMFKNLPQVLRIIIAKN